MLNDRGQRKWFRSMVASLSKKYVPQACWPPRNGMSGPIWCPGIPASTLDLECVETGDQEWTRKLDTNWSPVFLLFVVKENGVERSEFVNIGEAARRLGTSEPAIRRRIQRGDLTAYAHPLDMRMKLLKIA